MTTSICARQIVRWYACVSQRMNSFLGIPKLDAHGAICAGQDCMFKPFSTEENIVEEFLRDHPALLQLYKTQQTPASIKLSYWRNKLKAAVRRVCLYYILASPAHGAFPHS